MLNLAAYGKIRVLADRMGLESIDRKGGHVIFKFRENAGSRAPDPGHVMRLVRERGDLLIQPPASLRMDLAAAVAGRAGRDKEQGAPRPMSHAPRPTPHVSRPTPHAPRPMSHVPRPMPQGQRSWWTARATEAEVRGGFTKDEILKPAKEDPRAPGGVFDRVTGLLEALLR
jgi:hypothetical protein